MAVPEDVELIGCFQFAADKLEAADFILGVVEAEEQEKDVVVYNAVFYHDLNLLQTLLPVEDIDQLNIL